MVELWIDIERQRRLHFLRDHQRKRSAWNFTSSLFAAEQAMEHQTSHVFVGSTALETAIHLPQVKV